MGADVPETRFTGEDRRVYRERVRACVGVLAQLLEDQRFERDRDLMGIEVEFYVVDDDGHPMLVNEELLARMENEDFQTELAQFNIEFNLEPHRLHGRVFSQIEEELDTSFEFARRRAAELDAHVLMIGVLPTVRDLDVTIESMSANPRYRMLNDEVLAARGEDLVLDIPGPDRLELRTSSITMEAAATSVQLHLQVSQDNFARLWNASQAIAAAQVALGANSPFFLGRELMHETRIALFEQIIDTRTEELAAQGVRPRVWFGEKWITSPLELFEENATYFTSLLPLTGDEDPAAALAAGDVPQLEEMRLHNGTVYRWNRPIYDIARGKPHLRVENRVLPAGPTVVDILANAAFWYGLARAVATQDEPIERQMSFSVAEESFNEAARHGIDAELYWPGVGTVPAAELVLRTLLPLAEQGLDAWGVARRDRDLLLGIIEQRCLQRTNGATWQLRTFRRFHEETNDRHRALMSMVRGYRDGMVGGEPVHTWD